MPEPSKRELLQQAAAACSWTWQDDTAETTGRAMVHAFRGNVTITMFFGPRGGIYTATIDDAGGHRLLPSSSVFRLLMETLCSPGQYARTGEGFRACLLDWLRSPLGGCRPHAAGVHYTRADGEDASEPWGGGYFQVQLSYVDGRLDQPESTYAEISGCEMQSLWEWIARAWAVPEEKS